MSEIKDIKELAEKGDRDGRNGQKRLPTIWSGISLLREANEPLECVALLKALNDMITTLYELSDGSYYLDHIWNAGSWLNSKLKENGFEEDYFVGIAEKMETLRAILMGDALDYHELYEQMYHELLGYEAYWNKWHEEQWNIKGRELERMRRKYDDKS